MFVANKVRTRIKLGDNKFENLNDEAVEFENHPYIYIWEFKQVSRVPGLY